MSRARRVRLERLRFLEVGDHMGALDQRLLLFCLNRFELGVVARLQLTRVQRGQFRCGPEQRRVALAAEALAQRDDRCPAHDDVQGTVTSLLAAAANDGSVRTSSTMPSSLRHCWGCTPMQGPTPPVARSAAPSMQLLTVLVADAVGRRTPAGLLEEVAGLVRVEGELGRQSIAFACWR